MATYFIRIDTYWQNSADRFVGPFNSREAAETAIVTATDAAGSKVVRRGQSASDIKRGIRVHEVLSKTDAKRAGMNERNTLGAVIPLDTHDLRVCEDVYLAY
jgi:hypothetical protein